MSLLTEQEIEDIINDDYVWDDGKYLGEGDLNKYRFARAIESAVIEKIKAQGLVGVFADVNRLNNRDPLWEQMVPESYDGVEFIRLYRLPEGD